MTLTFDPLTLKVCGRSGVTWSWSHWSVVNLIEIEQSAAELYDHLAHFRRSVLGGEALSGLFSGVRGPNFTKLGEDTGRSWSRVTSLFQSLAAFTNAGASTLSDFENDAKCRTF